MQRSQRVSYGVARAGALATGRAMLTLPIQCSCVAGVGDASTSGARHSSIIRDSRGTAREIANLRASRMYNECGLRGAAVRGRGTSGGAPAGHGDPARSRGRAAARGRAGAWAGGPPLFDRLTRE